jgi:hypothetical protein
MAVENILKGTDVTIRTFEVKDSAGANILIANLEDYNIYVYQLNNNVKTHLFTFRKTPVGDDKQIVVVDTETIGFVVDRTQTVLCDTGRLYAEIEVQLTANSNYISSLQNVGNDAYVVCNIVESANPLAL